MGRERVGDVRKGVHSVRAPSVRNNDQETSNGVHTPHSAPETGARLSLTTVTARGTNKNYPTGTYCSPRVCRFAHTVCRLSTQHVLTPYACIQPKCHAGTAEQATFTGAARSTTLGEGLKEIRPTSHVLSSACLKIRPKPQQAAAFG